MRNLKLQKACFCLPQVPLTVDGKMKSSCTEEETEMVIVEFFSRTPIDNMITTLANRPERVIFVGELKRMQKHDAAFRRFLQAVGNDVTQIEYRHVRVHELSEIVKTLEQIVLDYPRCHFDITGGDALVMTATGVIYERYRNQGVELHQYNIHTGKVYDCDLNGETVSARIPALTVEQMILLHGGSVVTQEQREDGTYEWQLDEPFREDVSRMWEICKPNCGLWNRQMTMLGDMIGLNMETEDPLRLCVNLRQVAYETETAVQALNLRGVFPKLEKAGLISDLEEKDDYFSLRFKNEQVKKCLTKAGTILELITCLMASNARKKDNSPYFDHMLTGVLIDWDGVVHDETEEAVDTENEIDVILVKGVVPIFISCKNGSVGEEELYKLSTVADKFGGAYVKKVLVGTTLGRGGRSKAHFLKRAQDMNIRVIEGAHKMTEKELEKQLKTVI